MCNDWNKVNDCHLTWKTMGLVADLYKNLAGSWFWIVAGDNWETKGKLSNLSFEYAKKQATDYVELVKKGME